jgi:hypothetical protein
MGNPEMDLSGLGWKKFWAVVNSVTKFGVP